MIHTTLFILVLCIQLFIYCWIWLLLICLYISYHMYIFFLYIGCFLLQHPYILEEFKLFFFAYSGIFSIILLSVIQYAHLDSGRSPSYCPAIILLCPIHSSNCSLVLLPFCFAPYFIKCQLWNALWHFEQRAKAYCWSNLYSG